MRADEQYSSPRNWSCPWILCRGVLKIKYQVSEPVLRVGAHRASRSRHCCRASFWVLVAGFAKKKRKKNRRVTLLTPHLTSSLVFLVKVSDGVAHGASCTLSVDTTVDQLGTGWLSCFLSLHSLCAYDTAVCCCRANPPSCLWATTQHSLGRWWLCQPSPLVRH